jgi:PAS domain S-box-containing protein
MHDALPRRLPEVWLRRGHLLAGGVFVAAVTLVLALLFIEFVRHEGRSSTSAELRQLTTAMEKHTGASLDAIQGLLLVLANSERSPIDAKAPGLIDPVLAGVVRGFPQVRSVSVLDAKGHVLASTTADNLGHWVDVGSLGVIKNDKSKVLLGPVLNVRDLFDPTPIGSPAARSNVFPMVAHLSDRNGHDLLLLALINADYFAAQYESIIMDKRLRVALTNFEGGLLVATSNVGPATGRSLTHLAVFSEYLPQQESGSYLGTGIETSYAFVAFSTLRHWPLILVATHSYMDAMVDVSLIERWVSIVVVLAWFTIAALTYVTIRNLSRSVAISHRLYQEVFASDARSSAVLESSIDGVITIDSTGHIVAFNPAAERMFGRTRRECVGQSMDTLLVPEDLRQAHHDGIERFRVSHDGPALNRLNRRIETIAMHSDGSLLPIELAIVSVDINGQLFFTANVRDISAQKIAAQQTIDLLGKYHSVASDLEQQKLALDQHAIVSIVDANETIIYANEKLVEISGYTREELLGKKLYGFRNPLAPAVYAQMREHLAEGKIWSGELHMRHRNGTSYWVTNTSVPVYANDGKVRQYITIQTDVTDFRKAEIALKEARTRELNIGSRIQQSLLSASVQNHLPGLWLSHFNQASKGVDGDFIDIITLGEHCVDVVVGDVMGKGVPAALLGAATKLQFSRSLAELLAHFDRDGLLPEPQAIVASVHQAMTPHLQALDSFVTLAYIRIDLERNLITWVGCGHEESLLIRSNGQSMLLPNQQPPLGVLDSSEYMQDQTSMAHDDVVFLCSDGLPDAIGADGERLGRDHVNATLRRLVRQHPTPSAALHALRHELLDSTVQINDDVSLALIMRPISATTHTRCEVPIELHSIGTLRQFVLEQTQRAALQEADAAMFELACVEVFTNIVRHAKGLLPGAPVEITSRYTGQELVIEVIHLGDAFTPPVEPVEPDLSTFPEGGFGMTIIRSACSRVEFLHHDGVNTIRMTRTIAPGP